jgi:hypothetical protein
MNNLALFALVLNLVAGIIGLFSKNELRVYLAVFNFLFVYLMWSLL